MKLTLLNNLYVPETGDTLAPGTVIDVKDTEHANGLIERGTAVATDSATADEVTKQPAPLPPTPSVPTPDGVTAEEIRADLENTEASSTLQNNEEIS